MKNANVVTLRTPLKAALREVFCTPWFWPMALVYAYLDGKKCTSPTAFAVTTVLYFGGALILEYGLAKWRAWRLERSLRGEP